ncbi:hypothetical protein SANTM175S_05532 [Streptomyces antimycoticus]
MRDSVARATLGSSSRPAHHLGRFLLHASCSDQVGKGAAVGVERGLAAEVGVEHVEVLGYSIAARSMSPAMDLPS